MPSLLSSSPKDLPGEILSEILLHPYIPFALVATSSWGPDDMDQPGTSTRASSRYHTAIGGSGLRDVRSVSQEPVGAEILDVEGS